MAAVRVVPMPARDGRPGTRTPRAAAGPMILAALLVVAGCSASPDTAIPRPGSTFGGLAAPQAGHEPSATHAPAPAVSTPVAAGTCPAGLWATIKDGIGNPSVALVGLVDGCREARIETTLDRENVAMGLAICRKAAEVAFRAGVASITVTAADATRLASGATDAGCTAAP